MKLYAIAVCIAGSFLFQNGTAAQTVTNKVPIVLGWSDPIAPISISFEVESTGELAFSSGDHFFRGERSGSGPWLHHLISVHYPGFTIPLELRTWHAADELRLTSQLWNVGCDLDDFRRIKRVGVNSSFRDVLGAITAARYISKMSSSACPENYTKEMSQVYFTLSCNFAKKVDFFVLSKDARDAYRESTADGDDQAASCAVQSQVLALKELNDAHKTATEKNDWALADSYMRELRRLIADEQWVQAFSVAGIARTSIDALEYKRAYAKTLEASKAGDYYKALILNRKLQSTFAIEENRPAFAAVKLDSQRLENDATFFEARIAADDLSN